MVASVAQMMNGRKKKNVIRLYIYIVVKRIREKHLKKQLQLFWELTL